MKLSILLAALITISATASADINPNWDDEHYNDRKSLTTQIMTGGGSSDIAVKQINDVVDSIRQAGMATYYDSPGGNFRIHYDISGRHAPDMLDDDSNGVPDFVDSAAYYFEYVRDFEVNKLGYKEPYTDSLLGGSSAMDVYLVDVGRLYRTYGFNVPANIQIDKYFRENMRFATYITIDNNFSPNDSAKSNGKMRPVFFETCYQALKITAAHEYHHAVQSAYGIGPGIGSLMEMTSTYMERRVFSDSKDYFQYLPSLFQYPYMYPFGQEMASNGYKWCIFFQYTQRAFGDELLLRFWELVGEDIFSYEALDSALAEHNSTLADAFCDFLPWLYYTGDRAGDGESFDDAAKMPEINFDPFIQQFAPHETVITGDLLPYEVKALQFLFPGEGSRTGDTLSILITNPNTDDAGSYNQYANPFEVHVADTSKKGFDPLNSLPYFVYRIDVEDNVCLRMFEEEGSETKYIEYAYPNPFNPKIDDYVYFPAFNNCKLDDEILLTVYNANMTPVFSKLIPVSAHNENLVARWDDAKNKIGVGAYFYSLKFNDEYKIGKFAVLRK